MNDFFDHDWKEEKEEPAQSPATIVFNSIIDFLKTSVIVIFLALIIRLFVIQPFIVEGQSMEPSFQNNDYLITEKISFELRAPKRGEVVIFHPPDNPNINYIKRIVGLPGDKIELKEGNIYINDTIIKEPYLIAGEQTISGQKEFKSTLKDEEYFLLGDNRNHSRDSREIGAIPKENIVSKIWVRLLPLDNVEAFAAVEYDLP